MGWDQRTLTFRSDMAASQGCRGGAGEMQGFEVMRLGRLGTNGRFVRGGRCTDAVVAGFSVKSSQGLTCRGY